MLISDFQFLKYKNLPFLNKRAKIFAKPPILAAESPLPANRFP